MKMMRRMMVVCGVMLLSLMSACSTTQRQENTQNLNAKNSARIYIMHPTARMGNGFREPVYVNGTEVGSIGTGGALTWVVPVGLVTVAGEKHFGDTSFGIQFGKRQPHAISFMAKKGQVYYIKALRPTSINPLTGNMTMGGAVEFVMMDQNSGRALLSHMS
jgi:hypothetical protein